MIINMEEYRQMKEQLRRPFLQRHRQMYYEVFNRVFKYLMDFEGIFNRVSVYQDIFKKAEKLCLECIRTPEDLICVYKHIQKEKATERRLRCAK